MQGDDELHLDHMNPDDTFQIISFSDHTRNFADRPQKVSEAMKDRAHAFISSLEANGGTWMAPAVEQACKIQADDHRLRIVTFMTDGYVGNDFEIISMVKNSGVHQDGSHSAPAIVSTACL
jgi:Ca-activated chloride channel homolog